MTQISKVIDVTKSYLPGDPNSFTMNLGYTQREDTPLESLPVIPFDATNVLPTSYGYRSYFGTTSTMAVDPLLTDCDEILLFQTTTYKNILIALCSDGIYSLQAPATTWTQEVVLDDDWTLSGIYRQYTHCVIENNLYIYRQGNGTVTKLSAAGVFSEVTPTFLNMEGQMGIFRANGRLGFWDSANSVAWSSAFDISEFTPALETLAGNSIFLGVQGRIVNILGHGEGYIVYSTKSVVGVSYNSSGSNLWDAMTLTSIGGIAHPKAVCIGENDKQHLIYSNIGIFMLGHFNALSRQYDMQQLAPEIFDLLKEDRNPVYLTCFAGRYLHFSLMSDTYLNGITVFEDVIVAKAVLENEVTSTILISDELESFMLELSMVDIETIQQEEIFLTSVTGTTTTTAYKSVLLPATNEKVMVAVTFEGTPATIASTENIAVRVDAPILTFTNDIVLGGVTPYGEASAAVYYYNYYTENDGTVDFTVNEDIEIMTSMSDSELFAIVNQPHAIDFQINISGVDTVYNPEDPAYLIFMEASTENVPHRLFQYTMHYIFETSGIASCTLWFNQSVGDLGFGESTEYITFSMTTDVFHHIYVYRSSTALSVFVDDVFVGSVSAPIKPFSDFNADNIFIFGSYQTAGSYATHPTVSSAHLAFYLKDLRVTTDITVIPGTASTKIETSYSTMQLTTQSVVFTPGETYEVELPSGNSATIKLIENLTHETYEITFPSTRIVRISTLKDTINVFEFPLTPTENNTALTDFYRFEFPGASFTLQDGIPVPGYPTLLGSLVFDLQLKKWGKNLNSHKALISLSPLNETQGTALSATNFGVDSGTLKLDGTITQFSPAGANATLLYGKVGYGRLGFTNAHEIRLQFRTASSGSITVRGSMDGKTHSPDVVHTEDFVIALEHVVYLDKSARWFTIEISGQFDLTYLEFVGSMSSRR